MYKNGDIVLKSPKSTAELSAVVALLQGTMKKTDSSFFDEIENNVKDCAKFTNDNLLSYQSIKQNYFSLIMNREIIKMAHQKYRAAAAVSQSIVRLAEDEEKDSKREPMLNRDAHHDIHSISTTNLAGVIDTVDKARLRKLIFRATRGKAICITEDIDKDLLK